MDLTASGLVRRVSLESPDGRNTIDAGVVDRLSRALADAEADAGCRVVVVEGSDGVFSTGMDLVHAGAEQGGATDTGGAFFDLLDRFTSVPLVVVSLVDGTVAGGGVGIVAASDLVFASERSTFALPEALWGLLPCCVLPFLARRVGFQRAYAMTLTTQPVDAAAAHAAGLADDVRADPAIALRQLVFRAGKLDAGTIGSLKRYARTLHPITAGTRETAVTELGRLMDLPDVRGNLVAFAEHGRFPWQSRAEPS